MTPPALAAYFAGYNELGFLLDDQLRAILYRLTPAAFEPGRIPTDLRSRAEELQKLRARLF